ncbi:glycosyltransferase [Hymenobacter sp. BT188]|uniref:glycosyltransferase n=1 Tax=Hymenobacter sp. BT188 TaxID=2763504 RepID=UPI00165186A1|nr:glycosyltransferase [Hymenobacter sp. BT188]MBC6607470.1 glycosyltransferase [Hymenobacter sp. BT188]
MPKILHILHSLRFSGAEVMLRLAAPTVNSHGFDQHILADGPTVGDYASTLVEAGFTVYHRPYVTWSIPHLWRLYRFMKQHQFNVVHNHTEQNFFWYLLVARLAGITQLVSTVHNAFDFRGQVRWRRGAYRWIARRIFGTQFTAIGPSVAQVEARTYYNPTVLVPNWLDEQRFVPALNPEERVEARRHFAIPDNAIVLISVGGCSDIKNHGVILESLVTLRTRLSQPLIYLHVGEGDTHEAEQQQAKKLGVADVVKFVGQLHDVRQALLASDIFVMPSLFEGLGNSLLEALSCGVPAVVYDVYGLRDLVVERQTGRCVPPKKAALIDALQELIERPDLRHHYGKASREFVQQHYSMHDSLSRLLPLYGLSAGEGTRVTKLTSYAAVN